MHKSIDRYQDSEIDGEEDIKIAILANKKKHNETYVNLPIMGKRLNYIDRQIDRFIDRIDCV